MRRLMALLAVLGLILAACSSDPTASEEYQRLDQQLADTEQSLADVTAERDALVATAGELTERYDKALATQQAVEGILNDPESYGSEDEVVELLASYATEDAVMDDAVFGAVPIKNAWYFTLYGGTMDSQIDNYYRWLSDDGSQGGALWLWHGTNTAGNPFELAGIAIDEYDDNGLVAYEYVVYPYPDDYVRNAVDGTGTAQALESQPSGEPEEIFVFGEDDLCEWVTEEEVTDFVRGAYEAAGVEWDGEATLITGEVGNYECQWTLTDDSGEITALRSPGELGDQDVIVYADLDEDTPVGVTISGHPDFGDNVLISNIGWGSYAFWTTTSEDQLVLWVNLDVETDSVEWETPLFIVANGFLDEMNWKS